MILYFDNYITNIPFGIPRRLKDNYRSRSPIYAMPSRFDIAKYSLASYAVYPWSHVLIKYQIDDEQENQEFYNYAKKLFPNAMVIQNRSASQAEYKKSIELLDTMNDDWIFYVPNSDHPLLLSSTADVDYINTLLKTAEKYKQQTPYLEVAYSMFSEYNNYTKGGSLYNKDAKVLEENDSCIVALIPGGDLNSVVMLNKAMFKQVFTSVDVGNKRVIRMEDLVNDIKVSKSVLVLPKRQLAAHFDGYEHMLGGLYEIRPDQIPSLFIPPGFFEGKIRIAYGYSDYRPGWVNINPAAKDYSYDDLQHGTDMKIGLEDVPLFWKERIAQIDVNPTADKKALAKGRERALEIMRNPWEFKNQGLSLKTIRARVKKPLLRLYPAVEKAGLLPVARKLRNALRFY